MPVDKSHILSALLAAGKITQDEYTKGVADDSVFNALVARYANQNGRGK